LKEFKLFKPFYDNEVPKKEKAERKRTTIHKSQWFKDSKKYNINKEK